MHSTVQREMDSETSNKKVFATSSRFRQRSTFRQSKLVPVEILIEIFLLSLPPIEFKQAKQRTSLALVCRFWNNIIETTPILWTRISISDGPSHAKRSLLKSAKSPIDVYGICGYMHDPLSPGHRPSCRQFSLEVKRHTERWRCVELLVVDEERPVALAPTASPFLESVELRSSVKVIADDGYLTLVTSAHAPRLRELFLAGVEFARWDISFPPTLSRLILHNIRISSPQILTVLVASPNLTVLDLSELCTLERNNGTPDSALVELASLREMTFSMAPSNVMRDVMARLKFPSDCKVSLECEISDRDTRASFLDPALSQYHETFQQLEEIIQARIVVPFIGVCVVLRYLHWEITLKLRNRDAVRDTLEWFGISTNERAVASHLENSPVDSIPLPSNIPISL
ncbi:hypothetical protein FRC05_005739 [Tulasnella sp. 425]|nr:hypothetical protein FRC05_005739 [Tulasnella sp. 425]